MAREHARILCRIWRDVDWRALTTDEQWMFETLLSQPTISNAGVIAYTPRSWSKLAVDMTEARIEAALTSLAAKRYLVVDEDTDELLVRTFMRNDGVSANGKVFKNALKVALQVQSDLLRRVLAVELRKVGTDGAKAAADELDPGGSGLSLVPPVDQEPTEVPGDRSGTSRQEPIADQKKSERPQKSCGVGEGVGEVVQLPIVVGSVGEPSPAKAAPTKRGTRVPEDFAVTAEMSSWAAKNAPDIDLATQTDNFVDHFRATPGQRGVKLDWVATWRKWMRTAQESAPSRSQAGRRATNVPPSTGDPHEWLKACWRAADAAAVARVLGLRYERPDLPVGIDGKQAIADFYRTAAQTWITAHRPEALVKLTTKEAA